MTCVYVEVVDNQHKFSFNAAGNQRLHMLIKLACIETRPLTASAIDTMLRVLVAAVDVRIPC